MRELRPPAVTNPLALMTRVILAYGTGEQILKAAKFHLINFFPEPFTVILELPEVQSGDSIVQLWYS
jgi:hypothetical protein